MSDTPTPRRDADEFLSPLPPYPERERPAEDSVDVRSALQRQLADLRSAADAHPDSADPDTPNPLPAVVARTFRPERWTRRWLGVIGAAGAIALSGPAILLAIFGSIEWAALFAGAFCIGMWFAFRLHAIHLATLAEHDTPRAFLIDLRLSRLDAREIADGLLFGRVRRVLLLIGMSAPIWLTLAVVGAALAHSEPTAGLPIHPLLMLALPIDLALVGAMDLVVGMRRQARKSTRSRSGISRLGAFLLSDVLGELGWLGLMYYLAHSLAEGAQVDWFQTLTVTIDPIGVPFLHPDGLVVLVAARAFYLIAVRLGHALHALSDYRQAFPKWLPRETRE